ncbi:MAG: AMP-binding protein [Sediminispirochaetaceae bacterium]
MGVLRSLTMENLLIESTESFGPFECVSFVDGTPYTYRDFYNRVVSLRSYFISRGIKKGDRVALLSENQPNWGVCYFAITTLGAVVVPILTDFHADEIRHILEHSEARAYCVSVKLIEKVRTVLDSSDNPVICADNLSVIRAPLDSRKLDKPKSDWELIEISEHPIEKLNFVDEEDLASIIYTSGTTGQSKGVILTHRNIVYDAEAASSIPNLGPGDRLLSILPLAHTYECTIGFITPYRLGSHVFYLSKPPAPVVLLPALKKVRPNAMLTVPLLIEKIYRSAVLAKFQKNRLIRVLYKLTPVRKILNRAAGRKLMRTFGGNIHFFGIGGAALAEDVEKFLREAHFPYAIGYGLTETAPLIAGCNAQNTRFRSTGPVLPGVSVKIDNPDKETGEGEILVKGPNVMKGYYKDPERTAEVLTEDGWFHTGDLGVFDGDEYLYIRGRLKSMILGPSGENIYPEAIEALINEYDFVNESLVMEHEGRLVARVHIDLDAFGEQIRDLAESAGDLPKQIGDYLKQLRKQVNKRLNVFSRVSEFVVEHQPFEKTPTKKIKRYLYTQLGMKNKIEPTDQGEQNDSQAE